MTDTELLILIVNDMNREGQRLAATEQRRIYKETNENWMIPMSQVFIETSVVWMRVADKMIIVPLNPRGSVDWSKLLPVGLTMVGNPTLPAEINLMLNKGQIFTIKQWSRTIQQRSDA